MTKDQKCVTRAFELARTGCFESVEEITRLLAAEGYRVDDLNSNMAVELLDRTVKKLSRPVRKKRQISPVP